MNSSNKTNNDIYICDDEREIRDEKWRIYIKKVKVKTTPSATKICIFVFLFGVDVKSVCAKNR